MKFIYPFFDVPSHAYVGNNGISVEYPSNKSFIDKKDFNIIDGALVTVIRENVGYKQSWSLVKIIDDTLISAEYYNKELYIHQDNLFNVGGKKTYAPAKNKTAQIDPSAPEINPVLKEIYVPYIDNRNGLYSVRVQVDYEKIIDLSLFYKVLDASFQEGIRVLLSSRGYRFDNEAINDILNTYYTFAYINDDLSLTSRRPCEPITFTVSIPINFFDNSKIDNSSDLELIPTKFLNFTNKNFIQKLDLLVNLLSNKNQDLEKALFPNKILDTYLLEAELEYIKKFIYSTKEIMESINAPINVNDKYITEYSIGLDDDLNVITGNIKIYDDKGYSLIKFNEGILAQLRMRGEFSNKRIINYLLNLDDMSKKFNSVESVEYIKYFAKYPNVNVVDEFYNLNGLILDSEQLANFRIRFLENSTPCLRISEIQKAISQGLSTGDMSAQILVGVNNSREAEDAYASWCGVEKGKEKTELPTFLNSIKANKTFLDQQKNETKEPEGTISREETSVALFTLVGTSFEQIGNNIINDVSTAVSDPIAAGMHILRRLDAQRTLIKFMYCQLRGQNINDPAVIEFINKFPPGIINYIQFLTGIGSLKGWRYWDAVINGYNFDNILPFICNDAFTYGFKFIAQLINGWDTIVQASANYNAQITQARTLLENNNSTIKDPFKVIGTSIAKSLYVAAVDFVFTSIRTILDAECDDPQLDQLTDFRDPFSTHEPNQRFNNNENNNQNIVRKNTADTLKDILPGIETQLTYGYNLEYTVDLIFLLIEDIKCLLSPSESVALLRGEPSEQVVVLIKNIIRNKYSKEPNNLSYLLDDIKLKALFRGLGDKVDQSTLDDIDQTTQIIKNATNVDWVDVCKDPLSKTEESKLPVELEVIKNDYRDRLEKAKKALEYLQNPNKVYNISALCPENDDEDIENFKIDLVERYKNSIRDMFSGVLESFTQESNIIKNKFTEEKLIVRNDFSNRFIDNYKYETFHANLGLNLIDRDTTTSKIDKFVPKDRLPIEAWKLSDSFLKQNTPVLSDIECPTDIFVENAKLKQFLSEGRILFENRFYATNGVIELSYLRNWNDLDKKWSERGGGEYKESEFSKKLREQEPELREYIIQKKSVVFISNENDKLSYRHIYYDENKDDFKQLFMGYFYGDVPSDLDSDKEKKKNLRIRMYRHLSSYTGENIFINLSSDDYKNYKEGIDTLHKKLYKNIKIFNNFAYHRNNVYVLSDDFFGISKKSQTPTPFKEQITLNGSTLTIIFSEVFTNSVETVNYIQEYFKIGSETSLSDIESYERLTKSFEKFKKFGLFNIRTEEKNIVKGAVSEKVILKQTIYNKSLEIASSDPNTDDIKYVKYFDFSYKIFPPFNGLVDAGINLSENTSFTKLFFKNIKILIKKKIYESLKEYNDYGFIKNIENEYDLSNEIQFYDKNGIKSTEEDFIKKFRNRDLVLQLDPEYYSKNYYVKNYSSFSKLDFNNDIRYLTCNIFPHYLNLDYFLNKAGEDGIKKLCDSNLQQVPEEIVDDILVNITVRTYITDICVKITPLLCLLDIDSLNKLYTNKLFIDIVRNFMEADMNMFTNNNSAFDDTKYYNVFVDTKVKKSYSINKLLAKYTIDEENSTTKEIDYFIRKEINHYIKFALNKKIIKPTNSFLESINDNLLENVYEFVATDFYTPGMNSARRNREESEVTLRGAVSSNVEVRVALEKYIEKNQTQIKKFIENEFYSLFAYMLGVCTVEFNKKNIFGSTKAELAKINFSLLSSSGSGGNKYKNFTRSQESVIKAILDMTYSPNPALVALAYPDMSKEVFFFLESQLYNARSILLTSALSSDANIQLTRFLNTIIGTTAGVVWSSINPEQRKTAIINAAVKNDMLSFFTYKRLDSSMPPVPLPISPDFLTSFALSVSGIPVTTAAGIGYLLTDIGTDTIWGFKQAQEMQEIKEAALNNINKEECEVIPDEVKPFTCTPEFREYLIKDLNKFEEK